MTINDSPNGFLAALASKIDFASGSTASINRHLQCAIEGEGLWAERSRDLASVSLPIFVYLRDHGNFPLTASSYREGLSLPRLLPLLDELPPYLAQPVRKFLAGIPGYLQAMDGEGLSTEHEFGRQYANYVLPLVRALSFLESLQEETGATDCNLAFSAQPRTDNPHACAS